MSCLLRLSCVALLLGASGTAAAAEPRSLTAQECVRLALERNPDVLGADADVEAATATQAGASVLFHANPSLTATAGPRTRPSGRTVDRSFELVQPLEVGGQRGARIAGAEAAVAAAGARARAVRADVAGRVIEGFARALGAEQRVHLASETMTLSQQAVQAAEERFAAGAAPLIEVNAARVELGRSARDKGEAERRRAEALGELFLLVGLDADDPVTLAGDLASLDPAGDAPGGVEEAVANRGEIAASRHALVSAQADLRVASREWASPRIGVSYSREESDTSIVQGIVSVDLPFFNRNQAARGVAAARVTQMQTALAAAERRVRQEVATATARLHAAREAAHGYAASVVTAMQQNMELAAESYREGKIDFLQLQVIRRQTLEARREHIDVLEELWSARAQLDRALGRLP